MRFASFIITASFSVVVLAAPIAVDRREHALTYGVRDVDSRPPYLRGRENQYDGLVPRTPMNMETAVTVVGKFAVAEAKAQGRPTTRSPTPPTPSEEEIKRHLNTPPRDKSLFWSGPPEGPPYQEPATELAHANGFKVLGDLWKDDDPLYPDRFSKKPGFWKDASAAMAQKTSGVANVVLPEDSEPHPASVWTTTERPALEENNDVTEIVKWTLEGGQGEVIHRAGIPDPSNSKLKAPSISAPAVDKSAAKHSQPEGSKVLNPLNPDKSRKRVQSEISTHTTTSGKAQVPLPETTGSTNDQSGRKRKARKTAKGKGAEYNKEVIHQAGSGKQKPEPLLSKPAVTASQSEGIKAPLNPPKPEISEKRVHSEVSTDTMPWKAQVPLQETTNSDQDRSERRPKVRKVVKENTEHNKEMIH